MKTAPLPEIINPSRLALSGQEIVGDLRVSELDRLKQLLASDSGLLSCRIQARKDEQDRVMVSGSIEATVKMNCQLCLKPMTIALQQNFELMVVEDDEEAAEILENYEPLLVQQDRVQLKELIEDEAILALPMAPSHDLDDNCQQHKNFVAEDTSKKLLETKQPFANLKSLMEQSSDNKD